jgi:hypothetical protein
MTAPSPPADHPVFFVLRLAGEPLLRRYGLGRPLPRAKPLGRPQRFSDRAGRLPAQQEEER